MIEGSLVRLRAREMADLERNDGWMNDREVTRYLMVRYPLSPAAEEAWMREHAGQAAVVGTCRLAIETKDGLHIGITSCTRRAGGREGGAGDHDRREGLLVEGIRDGRGGTLLRFAFEEMNLNRVMLHVYAFNERAQTAYRKAGFVEEGRMRQFALCGGLLLRCRDHGPAARGVEGVNDAPGRCTRRTSLANADRE